MNRMQANTLAKGLDFFDEEDLVCIEQKAKGLSFQQCMEFLGIDEAMLEDVDAKEINIAKRVHNKGRAVGISNAAEKLFSQMGQRNGGGVALDYLRQVSGEFEITAEKAASGSGFQFNVVLPEAVA